MTSTIYIQDVFIGLCYILMACEGHKHNGHVRCFHRFVLSNDAMFVIPDVFI